MRSTKEQKKKKAVKAEIDPTKLAFLKYLPNIGGEEESKAEEQ